MARRSLRPELNQIRTWVRQGRTDAWIAHQLEVTVQQIPAFKRENDLARRRPRPRRAAADSDDEIDLRAEDDALIAAELEAAEARREAEEAEESAGAADDDEDAMPRRRDAPPPRPPRRREPRAAPAHAARWREPSTTARRATGCGSTRPCRTTPSTPSTGLGIAR